MRPLRLHLSPASLSCLVLAALALAAPSAALGAAKPTPSKPTPSPGKPTPSKPTPPTASAVGSIAQLPGKAGCLVDGARQTKGSKGSRAPKSCKRVRALGGPAPFLGSNALAISGDGKHVYVASSRSDAIAIFTRNARSGKLTQRSGAAGCIALKGALGCAKARALNGPNSVAVSSDGKTVHATSVISAAVTSFRRNAKTGALTQLPGASGCVANRATPGCATGRALDGPDVVTVSPDGRNVYVGAFVGNALAVFGRNPSSGALTQPSDTTGCITNAPTAGCATGLALASPEGMAVSGDGSNVYVAAAVSNAIGIFTRDASSGALTQATDGSGCIVDSALAGCTTGEWIAGANALVVSPGDGDVYATSLLSNSVTSFTRTAGTGQLAQKSGTSACAIYLLAVGCSLARELQAPEGVAISPDGASVYAAAYKSGAITAFDRDATSGGLIQKRDRHGCVSDRPTSGCARGRGLRGASALAVSPDGRFVYAAAFKSNALGVFERVTRARSRGKD
jgi:DNA-binding beta-propeller fold protein YncE